MGKIKKPKPIDLARKPRGFPDKREGLIEAEKAMIERITSVFHGLQNQIVEGLWVRLSGWLRIGPLNRWRGRQPRLCPTSFRQSLGDTLNFGKLSE